MYFLANFLLMPNCSDSPKSLIPYTIPKFTAFADVLCSFVTSSIGTSNTFEAACLWMSSSFLNAFSMVLSPEICANTLSSICE